MTFAEYLGYQRELEATKDAQQWKFLSQLLASSEIINPWEPLGKSKGEL